MSSEFAVIFDMDGVLIDSVGLNWQAYNRVLERHYGFKVAGEELDEYVGMSLNDQIMLLSQNFGVKIDILTFEKESSKLKSKLFDTLRPKDGVVHLLKSLHEAGIPTGVGTSSPRNVAIDRLTKAGIWSYFEVCITEEDVKAHKPFPDVYIKTARMMKIQPESCVVIEDAPNGVEAARRSGMKCVAVTTPYVAPDKLQGADLIVESIKDISVSGLQELMCKA